jgi:chromosome transmission fidelity protein 18
MAMPLVIPFSIDFAEENDIEGDVEKDPSRGMVEDGSLGDNNELVGHATPAETEQDIIVSTKGLMSMENNLDDSSRTSFDNSPLDQPSILEGQSGLFRLTNRRVSDSLVETDNWQICDSFLFSNDTPQRVVRPPEQEREPTQSCHIEHTCQPTTTTTDGIEMEDENEILLYSAVLENGRTKIFNRRSKPREPPRTTERNYYGIPIHRLLEDIKFEVRPKRHTEALGPSCDILLSEKWRPKKWIDLLGPERTHRHMLRWLVAWSSVVFQTGMADKKEQDMYNRDILGRPQKKILLIHGPPGIGKTTVAHVIAKQAGYDVLEINASDERSGTVVREKILGAVESHRINTTGTCTKPVCVIADEIEGASENGFVKVLIDLINSDQRALATHGTMPQSGHNTKKRKQKSKILQRPIIAICNDLYANSLRSLRPLAEIVSYTKSPQPSIVTRLRTICGAEGLTVDTDKLVDIAQTADGDLRSSLNMIQFGMRSNNGTFRKDLNKSWSKVSNRVFRRVDGLSKSQEMDEILAEAHGNGEYDKLISGSFALFPKMHYNDDMVRKPAHIGEWTHFYEQLSKGIYQSQHGQLAEYLGHPLLAFYDLFGSLHNNKQERVPSDYEVCRWMSSYYGKPL